MEIDEKKLRDILAEQQKQTEEAIGSFRQDVDQKFTEQQKQTEKMISSFRQDVDQKFEKQQEQTERYIGSLKEDSDHRLDAVLEYVEDIPEIKEKQNIMFEQMGRNAEEIVLNKEAIKNHEVRLQKHEIV